MKALPWAAACILTAAVSAHAGGYYDFGEYATIGPILSGSVSSSALRGGAGLEATYGRSIARTDAGLGAFVQGQYIGDGAFDIIAGMQPTFAIVGLELGAGYRSGSAAFPGHGRIHLAPFISALGLAALSLRVQLPVGADSGVEVGLGLTFKLAFHRERFKSRWKLMPNN